LALADGLLAVAERLIPSGRGRPDQASLRRAISTTYYALFHRIIDLSATLIVHGTGGAELRQIVSRAFEHGAMKKLAQGVAAGMPHANVRKLIPAVPEELKLLTVAFVQLQEARHLADYDLTQTFSKADAKRYIDVVRRAFRILDGDVPLELKRFLIVLPMWSQLERR
jgi:uncharacterized protein (UPF0332 family)